MRVRGLHITIRFLMIIHATAPVGGLVKSARRGTAWRRPSGRLDASSVATSSLPEEMIEVCVLDILGTVLDNL